MNELYSIISIFITSGLLLAYGLMFLFASVPESPLLNNYRKARYAMAFAYLFFLPVEIAEYLFRDSFGDSVALLQTVTLAIAASQAFLFTWALLALVEVRFSGWRTIFREAALVLLFIIVVFTVYVFCSEACFKIAFYLFTGLYALLLLRYTFLFLANYRRFRIRMDNYFSDYEAGRLHWVAFSFFAALSIGVMALLSALFMSTLMALLFTVVFDAFYIYFALRFINYAHQFRTIEPAIDSEPAETDELAEAEEPVVNNNTTTSYAPAIFAALEKRMEQWIASKQFTQKGITIDMLAAQFFTNRNYLSSYINTCKKQTFRDWINQLRIEEAKNLLLQYPERTVTEIASQVGFSDKTNFRRHFIRLTSLNPQAWRNSQLRNL